MISAVVLLFPVLAAAAILGFTANLIRCLAEGAQDVQAEDLDADPQLAGSAIRGPDDSSLSFKEAIAGLQERERIRDLLGDYVPASVAAKMLAGDYMLEPQNAEACGAFLRRRSAARRNSLTYLSFAIAPETLYRLPLVADGNHMLN